MALSDEKKNSIAEAVNKKMNEQYVGTDRPEEITPGTINNILLYIFGKIYDASAEDLSGRSPDEIGAINSTQIYSRSAELCEDGYLRADFASKLVHLLIQGVQFFPNETVPAMSIVKFHPHTFQIVEVLKRIAFTTIIDSNRLKMAEFRGTEIISQIFQALIKQQGKKLLPSDWQTIYECSESRHRAVCDFIAGMTDRYCIEFYSRLVGINAPSIQKPY